MSALTPEIRNAIRLARQNTITNAWQLLRTAIGLFENDEHAVACFLAMTAIEEVGKLFLLQVFQGDMFLGLKNLGLDTDLPAEFDAEKLSKFLRNHLDKAVQAAATSLYINSGADRRHGVDQHSKMARTSGVVLLARSGQWMKVRNNCMYTDIDFVSNTTLSPKEFITREHAYYFICMGFEVLAEQAEAGFGSVLEGPQVAKSIRFWQDRVKELERFMERWSPTVDLGKLDFLANPEPLQEEANRRDKKASKSK